ncbi:MAG: hypothetical protein ACTSWY_09745 [Promethearchaeota archaeon]
MTAILAVSSSMLEKIYPPLTKEKVNALLQDYLGIDNSEPIEDFSLEELSIEKKEILEKVYVTKEMNNRTAIKARFLQYMEYSSHFFEYNIIKTFNHTDEDKISIILRHKNLYKNIGIIFISIMNKKALNQIIKNLNAEKIIDKNGKNVQISGLFLVCNKLERTFAKNLEYIELESHRIDLSFFIEFLDTNRPFENDDFLIIDDLKLNGFNFGALDDVLSVIKKVKGKGKYIVWKEDHSGKRKNIWEGIIYPRQLLG